MKMCDAERCVIDKMAATCMQQGNSYPKFYGDLMLKIFLDKMTATCVQQGISYPQLYGDLVDKFKKIIGNPTFSGLFRLNDGLDAKL